MCRIYGRISHEGSTTSNCVRRCAVRYNKHKEIVSERCNLMFLTPAQSIASEILVDLCLDCTCLELVQE